MTQIQVDDAELAKLMAELEASTGVVSAPVAPPPPEPKVRDLSDELAELEALGSSAPAVTPEPDNSGVPGSLESLEDDLAALGDATTLTGQVGEALVETVVPAAPPNDIDAALAELESEVATSTLGQKHKTVPVDLTVPTPAAPVSDLALELASLQATALATKLPGVEEFVANQKRDEAKKETPELAPPAAPVAAAALPVTKSSLADLINSEMTGAAAPSTPMVAPLRHYVDPEKFAAETAIKDTNLDDCFMKQSSLRAYYGTETVKAEAQYNRVKRKFEVIEAKLYDEHRRLLAEAGEAKITEKMVENAVKSDARWELACDRVIEAEAIFGTLKALTASLADRRDMLIQLGANARDESKGQARILAAREASASLSDRAAQAAQAAL